MGAAQVFRVFAFILNETGEPLQDCISIFALSNGQNSNSYSFSDLLATDFHPTVILFGSCYRFFSACTLLHCLRQWLCFICVCSSSILVKSGDGGLVDVHTHSAAGSPETRPPHPDLEPSLSAQHGLHLQISSALALLHSFCKGSNGSKVCISVHISGQGCMCA